MLGHIYLKHKTNFFIFFIFLLTANLGLVYHLFVQYSQSDLSPLRPLCGEAPGLDSNPGRADLVAGTLTTIDKKVQHLHHAVKCITFFKNQILK